MTMFILAKATLEGKPIRLLNHENRQRDFTCIEDVAQAIVRLIDHPPEPNPAWSCPRPDPATSAAPWKICNIGNNRPEELIYMVSVLEKEFGRNAVKEMLPMRRETCGLPMPIWKNLRVILDLDLRPRSKMASRDLQNGFASTTSLMVVDHDGAAMNKFQP